MNSSSLAVWVRQGLTLNEYNKINWDSGDRRTSQRCRSVVIVVIQIFLLLSVRLSAGSTLTDTDHLEEDLDDSGLF